MHKGLLIVSVFLFGLAAQAEPAAATACDKFIPCGTYEGAGQWFDVNNNKLGSGFSEKIIISPIDESKVRLQVYIYKGELPAKPWADAEMTFQEGGQYTVSVGAQNFGAGFCLNQVCTVAFRPVNVDDEQPPFINSFVNILRFEGTTLKRYNMVSNNTDDSDIKYQRTTLTRQ